MSVEILRRAAALMRERAQGANEIFAASTESASVPIAAEAAVVIGHYLAWHPVAALAVADWLDVAGADIWAHGPLCECGTGCDACDDNLWEPHARAALAVARAYLGEDA